MLSAYYGKKLSITKNNILPVSPICTSFNIKFLKNGDKFFINLLKEIHLENFFFFQKDIGPDMIIYLMLIGDSKKIVKFFTPYSVNFLVTLTP